MSPSVNNGWTLLAVLASDPVSAGTPDIGLKEQQIEAALAQVERDPAFGTNPPQRVIVGPMIEVAAVVFRNSFGHVLTVRKDSSTKFQLPGGKLEAGETPTQAAAREVAEEIGVEVRLPELSPLGTFDAPAANEPGETVRGHIFTYPRPILARAAAEIAEVAWVDPTNPKRELAHLLRDEVFPALES